MTALRKKPRRWAATIGGNRVQTWRSRLAAAVAHDAAVVSKLPSAHPRRRPSLAPVRGNSDGEIWLTLAELEAQQAREEQQRRRRLFRKFGIPVESWDIAGAPGCIRYWQWGTTESLVVGAFAFEDGCPTYWVSYVVLPQIRGRP